MSPGRPAASRQRQGGLSHWSGRTGCGPSPARLGARSRRRARPPWPTMSARKRKTSRRLDLPAALGPTTKRRSPTSNSTFLKFRQLLAARCVILMDGARPSCSMLRRILRRMTVGAAAQDPRAPLRAPPSSTDRGEGTRPRVVVVSTHGERCGCSSHGRNGQAPSPNESYRVFPRHGSRNAVLVRSESEDPAQGVRRTPSRGAGPARMVLP